ncbi:MAG: hypothetical protein OEY96_06655 [Gammaproteobacteria bacterium]|nr:hypothetical protein [Gammaproteobacteria bacterium]
MELKDSISGLSGFSTVGWGENPNEKNDKITIEINMLDETFNKNE